MYYILKYFKQFDISTLKQMLDARTLRQTFEEDEDAFCDLQELMFQQLFNAIPFHEVVHELRDYCEENEPKPYNYSSEEEEEEEEEED